MFGTNEQVGQAYFKDAKGKLLVTSIFYTIQGEGPYQGQPAVFVRLAKCQLKCSFCDTYFDDGIWLTVEEISEKVRQVKEAASPARTSYGLVITGGEPMLQSAIINLVKGLEHLCIWIQIESNGLVLQDVPRWVTLVISPKVSEPAHTGSHYLKPPLRVLDRANCLKFLLQADPVSPYHDVPDWAIAWSRETGCKLYISPMAEYLRKPEFEARRVTQDGTTSLATNNELERVSFWEEGLYDKVRMRANYEYAGRYCMEHGFHLTIQQHLFCSMK